ncbi:MAG: Na+/H+ antiporter NhaC family protein [Eggerthellaceae bacterium]
MNEKKPNAAALLPILVFLVFYLGCGIYYQYISPIEGQMGFYVVSVVVAFCIALLVAFIQNRRLGFNGAIHVCARGIGDDNITIMLFIFLVAGAFSGIANEAGGATSTANLLLNIIPANLALPGLFAIGCIISLAMGTSVGTITVLTPITVSVAKAAGLDVPLCVGAVVGGAMFGDNLSFISDTTIAATRTQGVAMKDKFRVNLGIALPAALITLAVLVAVSLSRGAVQLDHYDYNLLQALPYFIVLIVSICGVNVFIALVGGIVLFGFVGLGTGSLTVATAFMSMGSGAEEMYETMIVTILVASISALVREHGGFAAVLDFVRNHFHGRRGGMFGAGLVTLLMDIATANNTVAIVVAGPIAKTIGEDYGIEPKRIASLIDIFSCVGQGIIPYGAQLLVAASLANIASISIMPFCWYQFILFACVIAWIIAKGGKTQEAAVGSAAA